MKKGDQVLFLVNKEYREGVINDIYKEMVSIKSQSNHQWVLIRDVKKVT